jgi:glycosyltransferase involved in cell wall biosynthesis
MGGYRLRREGGVILAAPPHMDFDADLATGRLHVHPEVLRAGSLEEIAGMIADDRPDLPEHTGSFDGHEVYRRGEGWHAVPPGGEWADLAVAEERARAGVMSASSEEELAEAVREMMAGRPVEFAGWLPIYEVSGNCGTHPQFGHVGQPPEGYRFTRSGGRRATAPKLSLAGRILGWAGTALGAAWAAMRPVFGFFRPTPGAGIRGRWRILRAMMRLWSACRRNGASIGATLKFLKSRHLRSQLLLANHPGPVFLTSMPYTFGQWPWLVEIEDVTTLFYPMVQNGRTGDVDLRSSPYFPCVKALLEDESCKGIITHVRSTARLVEELFRSDTITRKVSHAPMGVRLPARYQRHEPEADDSPIDLLFINSWHQMPGNFYLRGGLDVLEAFTILRQRYPRLRLTMRTALPPLDRRYRRMIDAGWVRVIDRFLPAEEMGELLASSHIFLLPAARIHIVSLLQAMSYGLAVVGSDGWGFDEYLEDGRNGLVVPGRYGKVSWADHEAGMLREDYEPMYLPDRAVAEGLVQAISRLAESQELRARLGRAARRDVQSRYTVANWNAMLGAAFDRACGVERREPALAARKCGEPINMASAARM